MPKSTLKVAIVLVACIAMLGACTGARLPTKVAARDRTSTTLDGSDTTLNGTTATTDGFAPDGTPIPKVTVPGGGPVTTRPKAPPARSTLFTAKEDNIGISANSINLCAHAALTYGAAFNTSADDLNVHWTAVNAAGGIFGRKVSVSYENDDYKPETAVQAATACQSKGIFFLLGGIGFDQIPAVRNWAEANHMLYLHHTATVNGTANQHYSF
ncbi:MAG: branched-chain amino acid transport system substrate-binding protein, partial [Actinomycetota bacterium]